MFSGDFAMDFTVIFTGITVIKRNSNILTDGELGPTTVSNLLFLLTEASLTHYTLLFASLCGQSEREIPGVLSVLLTSERTELFQQTFSDFWRSLPALQ